MCRTARAERASARRYLSALELVFPQEEEPGGPPWARAAPAPRAPAARPSKRARAVMVVLMAVLLGGSAERVARPVAHRSPWWGASDAAMLARPRNLLMFPV
jgi:hypothetical protein